MAKLLFRGQTAVCLHLPALPASRLSSHGQSAHPNSCPSPPLSELPQHTCPTWDTAVVATPRMKHEPHPKKKPLTAQTLSNLSRQSPHVGRTKLRGSDVKAVPPRGDYVAVTWTALPSAFPIYCLLFHMCPEARQSTNTIHGGITATKHQTAGTVRVTRPPLAKRKKQLAPRSVFI